MPVGSLAQQLRGEVAQRADHPRPDRARSCATGSPGSSRSRRAAGRGCRAGGTSGVRDEDVGARQADLAQQLVEQPPGLARRTAGPACPRWRPGASPTNIRSASALPAPKTTVVRVAASCGQRVQPRASCRTALSSSRRSSARSCAAILDRTAGVPTRGNPAPCGVLMAVTAKFATGIPHGSWTEMRHDTASPPLRDRGRGPYGLRARRRSARRRARRHRPARRAASDVRDRPTASCCACPTRRSRRGARSSPPARSSDTAPAPPRSRRSRPHEAFSLHPLMTVPPARRRLRRRGRRGRRHDAARAGHRPRAGRGARDASRSRSTTTTAPPTTRPRRSPRTTSSRSRTPPSACSPPRAPPRDALVPLVRATVENWAARRRRARADRPDRPRRRGRRSRASARRSRSARPSCSTCSTRSPTARLAGRRAKGGGRMRTLRTVAGCAPRCAGARRAGRVDRPRARRWARCTRAT